MTWEQAEYITGISMLYKGDKQAGLDLLREVRKEREGTNVRREEGREGVGERKRGGWGGKERA